MSIIKKQCERSKITIITKNQCVCQFLETVMRMLLNFMTLLLLIVE